MLLHNDPAIFKELIQLTAEDVGLQPFQIEKDYFVAVILKELASIESLKIVFKGGTSLSKCYNVINRFSEDIDLAVMFEGEKLSSSLRKKLKQTIINVIQKLNFTLLNEQNIRSGRDFNKYEIKYQNYYVANETRVKDILLETVVVYKPYPTTKLPVNNYVTKYLVKKKRHDLIYRYELEPFMMEVQTINRTFIDKMFALCDYHLLKMYPRNLRHLYDLHQIWHSNVFDKEEIHQIMGRVIFDRQYFGKKQLIL